MKRWRVFRGGLSGRIFAAEMHKDPEGNLWVAVGEKHDVTEDVERILQEMRDEQNEPWR